MVNLWLIMVNLWLIMVKLWLIMVNHWNNNISGWWFETMEFYDVPIMLGIIHHPNISELHDFSDG